MPPLLAPEQYSDLKHERMVPTGARGPSKKAETWNRMSATCCDQRWQARTARQLGSELERSRKEIEHARSGILDHVF